jgi:hypothetical protein
MLLDGTLIPTRPADQPTPVGTTSLRVRPDGSDCLLSIG